MPYYLLLKSYLHNRTFYVRCRDAESDLRLIRAGVPQGSFLAPALYILFTSDFPVINSQNTPTYADDAALLASNSNSTAASIKLQT